MSERKGAALPGLSDEGRQRLPGALKRAADTA